nr:MAG TPA: hypothetical protein [Caudoviricetes sp.]
MTILCEVVFYDLIKGIALCQIVSTKRQTTSSKERRVK